MRHLLVLMMLLVTQTLWCNDLTPALDVIHRVAPWAKGHVQVEQMKENDGIDAYEYKTLDGKLLIKATSIPAAGKAFNSYLQKWCHCSVSMTGNNMTVPDCIVKEGHIPEVNVPEKATTDCRYRHFLNFCTLNYSASFWTWTEWERMIDYMVLNGINLTISTIGLEKVWFNTLKRFHFTEDEIFNFLSGPAFNAWHIMGNLEGWGGPITYNMIEKRYDLGKKVLNALRRYGIAPITASFYGMVPTALKEKYPEADIIPQGKWGVFNRTDILSPLDPLYEKMSRTYYKELSKLYGDFKYFAGEPFHEGGNHNGIDVTSISKTVFTQMRRYNPGCQWLLQAWCGNPTREFLSSLTKEDGILIWDFRGEQTAEWEERDGYYGFPFLWGVINNFGETTGLYGKLERFTNEYYRSKEMYPGNMVGIGCSAEGILNNPVNYDLLFDLPWHKTSIDIKEWTRNYVVSRYGEDNDAMNKVWTILLETAYSSKSDICYADPVSNELPQIMGTPESLICAAPNLNLTSVSSWGSSKIFYDIEKMKEIAPYLIEASEELEECDAFQYDLVDFTRQILANEFHVLYDEYVSYYEIQDHSQMSRTASAMIALMERMDDLLSTRKEFMLGPWLESATAYGDTKYEKSLCLWNAKALITYWGSEVYRTSLRDYAHKEWAGLIKSLYIPRWKFFFNLLDDGPLDKSMDLEEKFTQMSIAWSHLPEGYPTEPIGNSVEVAVKILSDVIYQ